MNRAGGLIEALDSCPNFQEAAQAEANRIAEQQSADDSQIWAAVVEAAYLVAIADGELSQSEADRLCDGVYGLSESISNEYLQMLLDVAIERHKNEGAPARMKALAADLEGAEMRRAALLIASALAWADGGVGTKQGLALQALAREFGFSINELHKIMAEAAKIRAK